MIKNFKMEKLFGFRNIDIPFDENVKILIGENGLGKTTILNTIYYVLTQKYIKLQEIPFERIELTFTSNDVISFSKHDVQRYLSFQQKRRGHSGIIHHLRKYSDFDKLTMMVNASETKHDISIAIKKFLKEQKYPKIAPEPVVVDELLFFFNDSILTKFQTFKTILEKLNMTILYFPTYRRVEEDFKNLGKRNEHQIFNVFDKEDDIDIEYENDDIAKNVFDEDTLIHFGMEDVKKKLVNITEDIKKSTIAGFSKLTGEMLSQLLQGFPAIGDGDIEKLNTENASIVLFRLGSNLPEKDRQRINVLLENKKDLKQNKELVHFLFKLLDIYYQHKPSDDAIKQFVKVCNHYLEDKKVIYDESTVDILFKNNINLSEVSLDKLSSGEKQIVSLFSKIYLESNNKILVLFDEPELSLSMKWQKLLLPDIMAAGNCKFLLAVTHSPFIFKNDLEQHAVGLNLYVTEQGD